MKILKFQNKLIDGYLDAVVDNLKELLNRIILVDNNTIP